MGMERRRRLVHLWTLPLALSLLSCGDDESTSSAADADVDRGEQLPDGGTDIGVGDVQPDLAPGDAPQDASEAIVCGANECSPLLAPTPIGELRVEACCASDPPNACGLDTSAIGSFGLAFDDPCQALNQEGDRDSECPTSPVVEVPVVGGFTFAGCCRPEGQCGYLVDRIEGIDLGLRLGCVESPFPEDDPGTCTPGDGGGDPDADAGSDMGADVDDDAADAGSDADTPDTATDGDASTDG